MLATRRHSILLTISACLLVPATAVILWAAATDTSHAAGEDKAFAYAYTAGGNSAFLGVELREETEYAEGGARIERVVEDSAAEKAGLAEGDIIVAFDGHTTRGPLAVTEQLAEREPGDEISLTIVRDGRERSIDVELGERTGLGLFGPGGRSFAVAAPKIALSGCEDDDDCSFSWTCTGDDCEPFDIGRFFGRRPMLGVQLAQVTDELRVHLGGEPGEGALVSRIVEDSPAEAAGIEVGDLIVAVDGKRVENVGDIRSALADGEGKTIVVEVIRDRRPIGIDVSLPDRDDDTPTGPRALLQFEPRIDLRGLREQIDHALGDADAAAREARAAYRDALRTYRRPRIETRRAIRESLRERLARANSI